MQVLLSEQEVSAAMDSLQNAIKQPNGKLLVDLQLIISSPAPHIPSIVLDPESRTVQYGRRSVRLSPVHFAFLSCVIREKRATCELLLDEVWGRQVSDVTIRATCSRVTNKLLESDIPYTLVMRRSVVSLEQITT